MLVASDELIESLVRLWRVLHTVSAPTQQGDITAQQFWLLRQLRRIGPARVGDLAGALGIAQNSVTTASQRLEGRGLVTRERSREDERVVVLSLTEVGAAWVDAWREERRLLLEDLLTDLDIVEREQLHALLDRVLARAGAAAR